MRRSPLKRKVRLKSRPKRTLADVLVLMAHFGVNPSCKRCGKPATDLHHIKPKGRGGSDRLTNLVPLDRTCHSWVHANPDAANAEGLLLHSWQDEYEEGREDE